MLNDISLFVQIVRSGSLSKASKKLSVPANTLSRRLINLERQLGTSLILRSTQALRCTADGERLFKQCSSCIDDLNSAISSIQSAIVGVVGKVKVQVPSAFFDCSIDNFFCTLLALHPGLEVEVLVSDKEPDLIQDGIDLLFYFGELRNSSYIARKLCRSSLGIYASVEYLYRNGTPECPDDLSAHTCIHYTSEDFVAIGRRDGGARHSVAVNKRFLSKSIPALVNAAEQGLGLVFISTICTLTKSDSLVRVLPDYVSEGDSLFAAYSNRHALSNCARDVMDYAVARADAFDGY